uniref:Uncharacterized protein n=1 Tax=viral metagenome TaxID=1070528 RepID=A0A6M3MF51_9ZZZZ
MMATRKKKTEKENIPEPIYKGSRISIDPNLMGRFRRVGRNPLDDELKSEDDMLAHDLKSMRVDEIVLKRRARIAKLQKEIEKLEKETEKTDSNDSDIPRISVAMAQQIGNLPPEERNKVIETYAAFRSIDQSKGRGDALLPLLIGYSKTNPGTQQSDMATYAKAMADQFKTGIDVMKSVMPPQEKASNATEVLKLFKDLVTDSVKKPMEQMVKNMQPNPSAFEQILMNPEMFSRAKEIGMFGSREPRTGSTNVDLEIEKLRGERELSIKKLDLEWRKSMLENDSKDRRTDTLLTALTPLSAIFAGPATQRMRQLGQQQATYHVPPVVMPPPPPPPENTIQIKCSCGFEGPMTFPGPPPDKIKCPTCGQMLVVGGTPSENGNPEKADRGT